MLDNPPSAQFPRALTARQYGVVIDRVIVFSRREIATIAIALALLPQIDAGVALRGLFADGAFQVTNVLGSQGFVVFQPARWLANILLQAPTVAAIWLGTSAPATAALIFSLTCNLLPGLAFLACRATLPRSQAHYMVFPAFVYFAGALAAQFASVTEGLLAAGYLWILFFLLWFGKIDTVRLTSIVLLSVGSIVLHEAMVLVGPVLLLAMWLRRDAAAPGLARRALYFAGLCVLVSMAVGLFRILFPMLPRQRADLIHVLLHFRWFFMPGNSLNLPAVLGTIAAVVIVLCAANPKLARKTALAFGAAAIALAVLAYPLDQLMTTPTGQFAARDNALLLSVPLMLLVMVSRYAPHFRARMTSGPIAAIVVLLGVSVSLWHVQATEKWRTFVAHFQAILVSRSGIIPSQALELPRRTHGADLTKTMIWWTNPDLSILLAPSPCVTSLIAAPTGGDFYPYDLSNPDTLPPIPGITYAYLLPPERQAAACVKP